MRIESVRNQVITYTAVLSIAIGLILGTLSGLIDSIFFPYTQVYAEKIGNPLNPSEKLFLEIKVRSTTFTANTLLPTEIFLFLDGNFRGWSDYTTNASETYSLYIVCTLCGGIEARELPERCLVRLTRSSTDSQVYYNATTLTYSHGGEFDVLLDGLGSSVQQSVGHGWISIAPTETLHEYRTFRMSFIIGVIAAAFAALSVYEQRRRFNRSSLHFE